MTIQTSIKASQTEKRFHVLNLKTLRDEMIHQTELSLMLGTKDFDTKHSVKIGEFIIEPVKNTVFIIQQPANS